MTSLRLRPLILVNSGAYAAQELSAEFGVLPPAFLPVGLGRLYELQARLVGLVSGDFVLTIPESFELSRWDADKLQELGFAVVRTPDELTLGAALLHALGHVGLDDRPLRILHGDTLISGIDLTLDNAAAVANGGDGYRWGHVSLTATGYVESVSSPEELGASTTLGPRLCGYFAFPSVVRFAEKLAICQGNFYDALTLYTRSLPLRAIEPDRWLDFGHVQTYFRSRRIVTTERSFNSLEIGLMHVRKRSSSAAAKLKAEARWLREAPPAVAPFCARVLAENGDESGYWYDSEYEYMPTLAELFVFGRVNPSAWSRILSSCGDFIEASVNAGSDAVIDGLLERLVVDKTAQRLEALAAAADIDLDASTTLNGRPAPSLRRCLAAIERTLVGAGDAPSVMHGDFCFSNILYSFRTDRVRLIDPRGLTERGDFSLYGDMRYDLAKLMHSISGRYDLIMAGQYVGGRTGDNAYELAFPPEAWRTEVEDGAKALTMGGVRLGSPIVWAAMTSLFLSMPPLHADRPDRQMAFLANALRLHLEMEEAV